MKTGPAAALALLALAASAHANVPLRWAPVLRAALPAIRGGRAGRVAANADGLLLGGLDAGPARLSALAGAGVADLEGLTALLRAPDARARAARLGMDPRALENLRRSLDALAPVVGRLQARGLTPDSSARADFSAALTRALAEQASDSGRRARRALAAPDVKSLDALIVRRQIYLDDALLDALAKAESRLLHAPATDAVAAADRPDPNALRDAPAQTRPASWRDRLSAAVASLLRNAEALLPPRP